MKTVLDGTPASPGKVKGKVKVIKSFDDIDRIKEGDVLVTIETNPQYTIAIMKASAVITEIGGFLSHAAIVAREMGVPCVVNVKNATTLLKDNEEVIVDGTHGKVFRKG